MRIGNNLPSRHQSDHTSDWSEMRSVKSTAAPNDNSELHEVDATSAR